MKCRYLLLTASLAVTLAIRAAAAAAAADIVEIHLNGRYYSEPATIQFTVAVVPDQANRTLRVEADGDNLYRSTEVTLEGSSEQRLHTVEFKNLPAGVYELRAEVLSTRQVRGVATQELEVMSGGR